IRATILRGLLHRHIQHQPQIRITVRRKSRVLVFDLAVARMAHALHALAEAVDVMLAPPARKLGACLFEIAYQRDESRIVAGAAEVETKPRDHPPRVGLPVDHGVAKHRLGEYQPQRVALFDWILRDVAEDLDHLGVPRDDVPARRLDVRGMRIALQHALHRGGDLRGRGPREWWWPMLRQR